MACLYNCERCDPVGAWFGPGENCVMPNKIENLLTNCTSKELNEMLEKESKEKDRDIRFALEIRRKYYNGKTRCFFRFPSDYEIINTREKERKKKAMELLDKLFELYEKNPSLLDKLS